MQTAAEQASGGSASTIRVVLADDHDLVRAGIKTILHTLPGVAVVGEARNGDDLLAVVNSVEADVVLTDISMPGLDGLSATLQIRAHHAHLRVLVLSMYDTADFMRKAIANGAHGYLLKDSPAQELEQALRGVMETGSYFGSGVAQKLSQPVAPAPEDQLTERQREILVFIARGKSSKEIAFDLGLSSKTVDVHRARIMERLGLGDVASLTRYAIRKGLLKA